MDNKNLMPQQAQPVNRLATGQQQAELAELSEETLSQMDSSSVLPSWGDKYACSNTWGDCVVCSYDGEDAE
ncbi:MULTISPECIES: DUF5837 family cyanobactin class RiPP [Kamptonema]|uniref:DUF5837 family cyanobactin class RiPP n=1 Tax=Kamptonema TaxID=1501433 RepID=UPI0002F2C5C0|nr:MULTISPECIES: DUF5837 family cyanobactin class RiPP [Kamptonema]